MHFMGSWTLKQFFIFTLIFPFFFWLLGSVHLSHTALRSRTTISPDIRTSHSLPSFARTAQSLSYSALHALLRSFPLARSLPSSWESGWLMLGHQVVLKHSVLISSAFYYHYISLRQPYTDLFPPPRLPWEYPCFLPTRCLCFSSLAKCHLLPNPFRSSVRIVIESKWRIWRG